MNVNVVNMFAAKKVKLHGMTSSKWTTRDKITQNKGLINLYTRDRKIIELDTNVTRRKTQRELKDIAKSVYTDRRELDNAIRGDKQKLRNTLSEHRPLQLAYQNSQPKKVIDEIDQLNFNRRKVLDRLQYDKKTKSNKLIGLKLEQALLEDRLKYEYLGQIKQEKEAQIITGKVQDAILRKEAAWSIHHIYREILDIMKRDALYFDSILATVSCDGYAQSKCFLGATKLGQLATEYLDDRRQEYNTLEKIIVKDMATRKIDIKILTENIEYTSVHIKQLLRKDSDITTCLIKVSDTPSVEALHKDITDVTTTLTYLKDATLVPQFNQIFPCLKDQNTQKRRLRHLAKRCQISRDTMLNKKNHAQLMTAILKTTVNDDLTEYKLQKGELVKSLENLKEQKDHHAHIIKTKRIIAANIRIALRQLLQLSYNLKTPEQKKSRISTGAIPPPSVSAAPAVEQPKKMTLPAEDEIDGRKILSIILRKFSVLMSTYFAKHKPDRVLDEAYKQVELMMQGRQILAARVAAKLSESSLLQGLYTEANQQLSRDDIKKRSAEIVAANVKNDDLVPIFALPRKKKFKPKK